MSAKHHSRALQVLTLQFRPPSWPNSHGYIIQELWNHLIRMKPTAVQSCWQDQQLPDSTQSREKCPQEGELVPVSKVILCKRHFPTWQLLEPFIPLAPLLLMFPSPGDSLFHSISPPPLSPHDWYFIFVWSKPKVPTMWVPDVVPLERHRG